MRDCAICGNQVAAKSKTTITCSARCAQKLSHWSRSAHSAACRTKTCEECGQTFVVRPPSGKARRGEVSEGRFCSRACRGASARRAAAARAQPKFSVVHSRMCEHCGNNFMSRSENARFCSPECRREGLSLAAVVMTCSICGAEYSHTISMGRPKTVCSDVCDAERTKRIRRAARSARKARQRNVTTERVDAIKVFERDGWRCQGCGRKTPRKLRGTYDDLAPELDHIIPLSKGGEHSYRNTQLLCRGCNAAKSDGPGGQLRLLG